MNVRKDALKDLVTRFDNNITAYKDGKTLITNTLAGLSI